MDPNARCRVHLDSGGLLLTADLRQARILRRLHDRAQIAAGRSAWPTAQILPLETWLARQWSEAGSERNELPRALPSVALRWLWRRLAMGDAPGLVNPAELGARARASWILLRAHGGQVEELTCWPLTRDQQAFHAWARAAERELALGNACDAADLARLLVARDAVPAAGPPILLAGFRRPSPAQAALFAALARHGWPVSRLESSGPGGAAWRHAATDPESERNAMVAWSRARLADKPDGVHGLIVPNLAAERGVLERTMEAALQPELELPGASRDRVFDLAGGHPLIARPVIEIALDAIQYALGRADWTAATRLLRSAHIAAGQAEQESRTRLDVTLRSASRAFPAEPAALVRAARRANVPLFAAALESAAAKLAGSPQRAAGIWAEAFGDCLAAWGWPGDVALESADWQAAMRLRELLHELASLGIVAQGFAAEQALAQLRDLAAAPFQPESGEPAIFVLDAFDDPGLHFDSLWVAGLTASAWPRPVRVDPFLPIELQRRLGMPRATAEDCVADAEAILAGWQSQSTGLVLSWPVRENDTDVDGSPLLAAALPRLPPPAPFAVRAELLCGAPLGPLGDDRVPPLSASQVRGGARVLELQSRCPFRAFGELRLHAEPLEEPQAGLDRRVRGQVLHRALERFWSGLGSRQALLALDPVACERRVAAAVDTALAELAPAEAGPRSLGLEREWHRRAIANLLALERARPPFTVIETEREMTGRIGGLELRLRVDRVDDADGSLIVIDYKSGATRGAPWRGARMDAPQLPLYAVLHPRRPGAIAIAETGAARARFLGVGDEAAVIEGVVPAPKFKLTEERESGFDWRQVTERWWAWLDQLAQDHAAGKADVDPKLAANTCRRCHLGALCRVAASGADESEPEEVGDGD